MILIADSGSTKTDWAYVDPSTGKYTVLNTIGYNPYFIDSDSMLQSLSETLSKDLHAEAVSQIYFYGAGCSSTNKVATIHHALQRTFVGAENIFVGHDLLGSARALLGHKSGFAAILGTGANTCIYDGNDCVVNINSLGYMLGDEGSGCYIGKKFLRDFMRNNMEPDMLKHFKEQFNLGTHEQIIQELYATKFPNRYLANFSKLAIDFLGHQYIQYIVEESFHDFFKQLVTRYPNYNEYSFNCVGSIGYVFRDILTKVALSNNMKVGKIIQAPLNDLVQFHLKK
jgi:glucosamine kinase